VAGQGGKLAERFRRWVSEVLIPFMEAYPEREKSFESTSGFTIERLYLPGAVAREEDYLEKLGFPGEYPYTRGVTPTMYRGKLWTMRQYAGFGTAEETNRRYHYLLERGQTGLSVAFDLPTQMGYDSDHPRARGEVGKVGVAIDTVEDMERLFEGIPLDRVTTSMTINAPATVLLAMYVAVAEGRGIERRKLGGTIQNDILKEYIARGTYIFPPEPSMKLTVDSFRFISRELPRWNSISVSGYHIREAGATAAQEIGFTLANAICYCEAAIREGLEIDRFAPRISFFFNAHNNLLEEVAKFRAARRLWAKIARHRLGAKDPRSWRLRFHAQTAGSMLTAQQPLNNIVRVTVQALAAVLGGTQSLHTNSYDEALALPSELAARIALRTQQILAHESGVDETIDPLGGSYYIEELTDRLEAEAEAIIRQVDELGGMLRAIELGFPQREIQREAYRFQKEVEEGRRKIVGVNAYQEEEEELQIETFEPKGEEEQIQRLAQFRRNRSERYSGLREALDELSRATERGAGICEAILSCVKSGATEGEIIAAMEKVWGRYREQVLV